MAQAKIKKVKGSPELRDRLARGDIQDLADKYGKSWVWIRKVVTGGADGDPEIIADAIELAKIEDKNRERKAKVIDKINNN